MKLEQLTDALKQTFGETLQSVILYGSAAAGDHVGKKSDYNVLVVVQQLGVEELRAFSKPARQWVKSGNPAPLFFTLKRLRESTDTFPIELSDIKESHKILFGKDVVSDLTVETEHLRLELESELKGKLIQLRESYLLHAAGSAKEVKELLINSLSTFLVLARAALRLWQPQVPPKKLEAAKLLAQQISFDIGVFEQIKVLKETGKLEGDPRETFAEYLKAIETIVDAVDAKTETTITQ